MSNVLFTFLFSYFGLSLCLYLQNVLGFTAVLASVLTGLVVSFLPKSKRYETHKLQAIAYSASFAAMNQDKIFLTPNDILLISLILSLLSIMFCKYFKGIGGKLGTISFLSVVSFLLTRKFL